MKKFHFLLIMCIGSFINLMADPPPKPKSDFNIDFQDDRFTITDPSAIVYEIDYVEPFSICHVINKTEDYEVIPTFVSTETRSGFNISGADIHFALSLSRWCNSSIFSYSIDEPNVNKLDRGWNKLLSC